MKVSAKATPTKRFLQEARELRLCLAKDTLGNLRDSTADLATVDQSLSALLSELWTFQLFTLYTASASNLIDSARNDLNSLPGNRIKAVDFVAILQQQCGSRGLYTDLNTALSYRRLVFTKSVLDHWLHTLSESLQAASAPDAEVIGQAYEWILSHPLKRTSSGLLANLRNYKRKQQGVFYTPAFVVNYMLERVMPTGEALAASTRILDPACGAGAFLLATYRRLIGQTQGGTVDLQQCLSILRRQLFGVDIDACAIRFARLTLLWETLAHCFSHASMRENDCKALFADGSLFSHLLCGDFLADESSFSNGNAWSERFEIIVGNPPYLRERQHKTQLDRLAESELGRRFHAPRMDLWHYFLHRSLQCMTAQARVSFILPSYWLNSKYASPLIEHIKHCAHVTELTLLQDLPVFASVAGQHLILTLQQGEQEDRTLLRQPPDCSSVTAEALLSGKRRFVDRDVSFDEIFGQTHSFRISDQPVLAALDTGCFLEQCCTIRQGIAENPARVTPSINRRFQNRYPLQAGVFVLSERERKTLHVSEFEAKLIHSYPRARDLHRYCLEESGAQYIVYSTKRTLPDPTLAPVIIKHLEPFRPIMDARRETIRGRNCWYHLHWPRDERLWQTPKIIARQLGRRPAFAVMETPCYVPFSLNVVLSKMDGLSLYALCAILNSDLLATWFDTYAKRRGVGLEVNGHLLRRVPLPKALFKGEFPFTALERLHQLSKRRAYLAAHDDYIPRDESAIQMIESEIEQAVLDLYAIPETQRYVTGAKWRG